MQVRVSDGGDFVEEGSDEDWLQHNKDEGEKGEANTRPNWPATWSQFEQNVETAKSDKRDAPIHHPADTKIVQPRPQGLGGQVKLVVQNEPPINGKRKDCFENFLREIVDFATKDKYLIKL